MKITSLRIILVVGALGAILNLNNAYPGAAVFANAREISAKGKGAVALPFPDVCKTPAGPDDGPVPIPYPSTVRASASGFGAGTKTTKAGETIHIKPTKVRTSKGFELAYEVIVVDKAGRKILLNEPKLFQLTDRVFCAVCVENGRMTSILELWLVTQK